MMKIYKMCLLALMLVLTDNANAYYVETLKIKSGQELIVNLPSEWVNELNNAKSIVTNLPWTSSTSELRIRKNSRSTCTLYTDNLSSQAVLTYNMDFLDRNYTYRNLNLTWYIELDKSGSGSSPNGGNGDEEPKESWGESGNYSISWYNKNQTIFTISSNKELAGMSYLVNNGYTEFDGCTINLSEDIDLSGKKWIQCKTFKGVFDGQGHTVRGVIMGTDNDGQLNFGFWQEMSKTKISNLSLEGTADYKFNKTSVDVNYVGGLVGKADECTFENCNVKLNISFSRGKASTWTSNPKTLVYFGGICGAAKSVVNSSFAGSITCIMTHEQSPGNIIIGGIVGISSTIESCESLVSFIKMDDSAGAADRWILGIGAGTHVHFCRSIIGDITVQSNYYWSGYPFLNTNEYRIVGIASTEDIVNNYSSIATVNLSAKNNSKFYYGGISLYDDGKANFSNNDVVINTTCTLSKGYNGSIAFSSEQMKTAAFAEELNMYSILELDGPVWNHVEGEYPYIKAINEVTAIDEVKADKTQVGAVYSLSGQRLSAPQKGINIIDGKKVIIR